MITGETLRVDAGDEADARTLVSGAVVHGGPCPATSDGRTTAAGTPVTRRFGTLGQH